MKNKCEDDQLNPVKTNLRNQISTFLTATMSKNHYRKSVFSPSRNNEKFGD